MCGATVSSRGVETIVEYTGRLSQPYVHGRIQSSAHGKLTI